ncbi:MAG: leucine-rich repeat protein [Oscillospiraceae bacterium]|nr:leucine-rich repeat protein [Oscillospiraceae bacterium]
MKKRLICLVLTMTLIGVSIAMPTRDALAAVYGPANFGTNLTWKLDTVTGELNIGVSSGSSSGSMPTNWSSTGAPWYNQRAAIKSAVFDSRVANIGQYAFYGCANLESVRAIGVTSVGQYAFSGCVSITSVNMPIDMPAVTSIGDYAFNGCAALATVVLPLSVNAIGTGAFAGCSSLKELSIGGGTGNSSFLVDSSGVLIKLYASGNNAGQAERIIKAPVGLSNDYSGIQSTVKDIDPGAFAHSNLETVTIPGSVNNIGLDAFSWSLFLKEAIFEGDAPQTLPSGTRGIFDNVASGFTIHYYPFALRWPTSLSTNWRGYTAVAMTSYITLNRSAVALEIGATTQLAATVYPTNASQKVEWRVVRQSEPETGTSEPEIGAEEHVVVTVTPEGVVHAARLGWADITATSTRADGVSVTSPPCRIYVVERNVAVTGVALNKTHMTLTAGGASDTLAAVIYPLDSTNKELVWSSSNTNVAYVDAISNDDSDPGDPGGSTDSDSPRQRLVVPVAPGSATITVKTEDGGLVATCNVTVVAAPSFVPVSNITLSTTTIASGATVNLTELATIQPSNATNQYISWRVVEQTTQGVTVSFGGDLQFPADTPWQTGTVVIEATVINGLAEIISAGENGIEWGYPDNIDYTKRFTINITSFLPVTGISGVPTLAYAGVPLQLTGTVEPVGTSSKKIEWSQDMATNTAGARLDPDNGLLIAQWPGMVSVKAVVKNGRFASDGTLVAYEQTFIIKVDPYITQNLDLRANPGGSVSGAGAGRFAGGETVTITATPAQGYVFAGWNSTNGGDFADAGRATTQFTMPGNATTVTAFFTYVGLAVGSGGSGGEVVLPTPVHYFTNSSVYIQNSGVSFGHVTVRDYQLFSYVTLDGVTLSRNGHYTASRLNGYTEIVIANGYLDALYQGQHTLTIHFSDYVTVSAVFTVIWTSEASRTYSDVNPSDWYYASVEYVSSRGWMTAKSAEPGRFRPADAVTQGEVIDAMYRMAGSPTVMNQHGQALQGRDASYEWARSISIAPIGGYYNLGSPITRQDIALMFAQLVSVLRLKYPVVRDTPAFADDWQIEPAARTPVINLYRAGIINGRSDSTFVPLGNMTRAEFAAVLHRFAVALGGWA